MNCKLSIRTKIFTLALAVFALPCPALMGQGSGTESSGHDGLGRLLRQADISSQHRSDDGRFEQDVTSAPEASCLIPNAIHAAGVIRRVSFQQDEAQGVDSPGFVDREAEMPGVVMPLPLGRVERARVNAPNIDMRKRQDPRFHPLSTEQEYVFDGSDRNMKTTVDSSWNVFGLDTEDTVGHFDTLDGKRIVTPSNRVAIYAPRFAAVRKVGGAISANMHQQLEGLNERMQTVHSAATDGSTTTKQNIALNHNRGSRRATGLLDQTRGVVAGNTTNVFGFRNAFEPYANTALIMHGKFHMSQGPLLAQGMQSALSWETDLGLRVVGQGIQPVIVRDVRTVKEFVAVESEDGTAILRVVKLADKMAARAGEEVEFTIRFDNISGKKIGNVTIMDNLTRRLEFVEGSDECSVEGEFINEVNEDDSLLLRWEITAPLEPSTGGIIRFRCRVR